MRPVNKGTAIKKRGISSTTGANKAFMEFSGVLFVWTKALCNVSDFIVSKNVVVLIRKTLEMHK